MPRPKEPISRREKLLLKLHEREGAKAIMRFALSEVAMLNVVIMVNGKRVTPDTFKYYSE